LTRIFRIDTTCFYCSPWSLLGTLSLSLSLSHTHTHRHARTHALAVLTHKNKTRKPGMCEAQPHFVICFVLHLIAATSLTSTCSLGKSAKHSRLYRLPVIAQTLITHSSARHHITSLTILHNRYYLGYMANNDSINSYRH